DSLTSVQTADIPLVLTDPLTQNYGGVMINPDNHSVGEVAGQFIGQALASKQSASVVILDNPNISFSADRVQGFMDGLQKTLPSAQIVTTLHNGDDQAGSQAALAKLIESGQAINAIFSITDTGAYGAVAALSAAHLAPDSVIIASVNAESQALDDI